MGEEAKLSLEQALQVAYTALQECYNLFSSIRGDWTDPRSDCREGWAIINAAQAVIKSTGIKLPESE